MSDKKVKLGVADWKRPAGPLNVWRIIEANEKLAGDEIQRVRISIQDIPKDRYDEAVEHMLEYFVADEVTCKCLKIKDDKVGMDEFRKIWKYYIGKDTCIGAFKLGPNDELLELVGMNVTYVVSNETEKAFKNFMKSLKSPGVRTVFEFTAEICNKVNIHEKYGVDKYLAAFGLSVKPSFRGQKIGLRILETRSDLGKKYNIFATSTFFSAIASQTQAERAGFETLFSMDYTEAVDNNGKPLYPGIQAKSAKLMSKRLP